MQNCEVSGKIMSMHESGIFEHEAADIGTSNKVSENDIHALKSICGCMADKESAFHSIL